MKITQEQIEKIFERKLTKKQESLVEYLNEYMPEFFIDNKKRIAAFIAQIGHESGRFRYLEEIASGEKYEGRADLGNTQAGDGKRFKGRGLIQITGRYNYERISIDLDEDFLRYPELLATEKYAVLSACWYWNRHRLNDLADEDQFRKITKIINGGYIGMEDRIKLHTIAQMVLNKEI